MTKLPIEALKNYGKYELADYIDSITQTPICEDKKYCDELISLFVKSK